SRDLGDWNVRCYDQSLGRHVARRDGALYLAQLLTIDDRAEATLQDGAPVQFVAGLLASKVDDVAALEWVVVQRNLSFLLNHVLHFGRHIRVFQICLLLVLGWFVVNGWPVDQCTFVRDFDLFRWQDLHTEEATIIGVGDVAEQLEFFLLLFADLLQFFQQFFLAILQLEIMAHLHQFTRRRYALALGDCILHFTGLVGCSADRDRCPASAAAHWSAASTARIPCACNISQPCITLWSAGVYRSRRVVCGRSIGNRINGRLSRWCRRVAR